MAIDTNLLYRAVRDVLVATNLNSTTPLSEIRAGKPSIGRYRGKTPRYDFPYAMIDIGPSRHSVGNLTNRFVNADGFVQYETNKEYLISVKVYSDKGESYLIANNFEFAFNFDTNMQQVHATAQATVMSTEQVTPLPDVLADDSQVEYNQFNVILSVRDSYVDTNTFTIDKIETAGRFINNSYLQQSFYSSFDEVSDFDGYFITPQGHLGTTFHEQSTDYVRTGTYSHKAWIDGANPPSDINTNNNHRGYPTIQMYKDPLGSYTAPLRVSLWVWLDIDLSGESGIAEENWFSFATFTDDESNAWNRTVLINLSKAGHVHLQHTVGAGESDYVYENTSFPYPQREWVHLEAYLDFSENGYAKVWQNGVLVSHANVRNTKNRLAQAHFGLYCPPQLTTGTCYNEDLLIATVQNEEDDSYKLLSPSYA